VIRRTHPALAGLQCRIGRPLPGRRPVSHHYLAGYNAAIQACNAEGAVVLEQGEPKGFVNDYVDGWRSGLAMARALGVRELVAVGGESS